MERLTLAHRSGLCAATALILLSGCCGFEKAWNEAANQPCQSGLAGRWKGTWESHSNSHNGSLRAIITPISPSQYRAKYHATFLGCIPFTYSTTLHAQQCNGTVQFTGDADLGKLAGGVYHHKGRICGNTYSSRYHSKDDRGINTMTRVGRSE